MHLFVTGVTGFVGGHLAQAISDAGHTMRCLVRDPRRAARVERLGAELVLGDVTRPAGLAAAMRGCDAVLNLANVYSFWERDPAVYERINVVGTRNALRAALDAEVPKVVHVSSFVVWGRPEQVPFDETTPKGPKRYSRYAESKYRGDQEAWKLHRDAGLPLSMIYPGVALGPGDTKTSGAIFERYLREAIPLTLFPDAALTYVHVRDVADAILAAAGTRGGIGEGYLVGNQTLLVKECLAFLSEITGVALPRWTLPDLAADLLARLNTAISTVTGTPPLFGLSRDAAAYMRHQATPFDGSKAQRELGLDYRSVSRALYEFVESRAAAPTQPP